MFDRYNLDGQPSYTHHIGEGGMDGWMKLAGSLERAIQLMRQHCKEKKSVRKRDRHL